MKRWVLALALFASSTAAAAPEERQLSGLIYVGAAASGQLRAQPQPAAAVVGRVPPSMRVVYRRTFGDADKPAWFYVEPPGMTPGWIAAAETSPTRPAQSVPKTKPVSAVKVDTSLHTGTVMTAAARGLDSRTKSATQQDEQKSLEQFAAFEKRVNEHFDDPEDAHGVYPTSTTGRRRPMAAQFREGAK